MKQQKSAWEGNWQARVNERIKERGYETLISFAERNPKATFFELAKMLGEQVAPMQVEQLVSNAYYEQGQVARYFRSALARHIRRAMPEGWNVADNFDFRRVGALIDWENGTPDEYATFTENVKTVLKNANGIPKGWLPNGADDPIIVDAFEKAGFRELELALA
jgi:hypothetical protein